MEEHITKTPLEEHHRSPTNILLEITTQKNFTLDSIQHLITSLNIIEINSKSEFEIFYKCIETLVKPGLVDVFNEERDYGSEDFLNIAENASKAFINIKHLLPKLKIKTNLSKHRQDILIPILILCGTHHRSFLWSNENAVRISNEVCNVIFTYGKVTSMKNLLCFVNENCPSSLLKRVLMSLRSKLTKDVWAKNPSICHVFHWLLTQITHPDLTDYIPDVLPPSLMFTDHHSALYKTIGIKCLHHILDNVPPTELKMYGRADVIYDALFHLLYCNEIEVVSVLYPCLLKFLAGQEGNMHCKHQPRRWNRYDEVYSQLIWHMEIEDKLVLWREYSGFTSEFIDVMGITISKHLKKSMSVFLEYLSIHDGPQEISRINSLKALCALIKVAWPRMEYHCYDIMKAIMSLMYDVETEKQMKVNDTSVENMIQFSKECFNLLKTACPEKFDELLNNLKTLDKDFPGVKLLDSF